MGYRIAAWVLSASGSTSNQPQDAWRLHSTLVIPDNQEVTALDCKSGMSHVYYTELHELRLNRSPCCWDVF